MSPAKLLCKKRLVSDWFRISQALSNSALEVVTTIVLDYVTIEYKHSLITKARLHSAFEAVSNNSKTRHQCNQVLVINVKRKTQ